MKKKKEKINYKILILAVIIGLLYGLVFTGSRNNPKNPPIIRFQIGDKLIHIHHWLWGSCLLILLFSLIHFKVIQISNKLIFVIGFFIGYVFQGIFFKDSFMIFSTVGSFLKILKGLI